MPNKVYEFNIIINLFIYVLTQQLKVQLQSKQEKNKKLNTFTQKNTKQQVWFRQ
jgi:hypothetical protein